MVTYAEKWGMLRPVMWVNGDYAVITGPRGWGFLAVHQGDKMSHEIYDTMAEAVAEIARDSKQVRLLDIITGVII